MWVWDETNCHLLFTYSGPFADEADRFKINTKMIYFEQLQNVDMYFLYMPKNTYGFTAESRIYQVYEGKSIKIRGFDKH